MTCFFPGAGIHGPRVLAADDRLDPLARYSARRRRPRRGKSTRNPPLLAMYGSSLTDCVWLQVSGSSSLDGFARLRETYAQVDVSATDIEAAAGGSFGSDPEELLGLDPQSQWVTTHYRAVSTSSSPHPHLILTSSSPHSHLILTSPSPHPFQVHKQSPVACHASTFH